MRLCFSTVFDVAGLQLSFLQVKEILQEDEDLSEIVLHASALFVTGEGDPAGGGGASLRLTICSCCPCCVVAVLELSFLLVKEILQEEEDLSEQGFGSALI
jgi:hypothetical protein